MGWLRPPRAQRGSASVRHPAWEGGTWSQQAQKSPHIGKISAPLDPAAVHSKTHSQGKDDHRPPEVLRLNPIGGKPVMTLGFQTLIIQRRLQSREGQRLIQSYTAGGGRAGTTSSDIWGL